MSSLLLVLMCVWVVLLFIIIFFSYFALKELNCGFAAPNMTAASVF